MLNVKKLDNYVPVERFIIKAWFDGCSLAMTDIVRSGVKRFKAWKCVCTMSEKVLVVITSNMKSDIYLQ